MSNQENTGKSAGTNKIVRIAVIAFMLVVLPALSYYYLSGGLKLRKDAIGKKETYGQVRPIYVIYPDGLKEDQIKDKVCVIHYFGEGPDLTPENRQILDTAEKLFDQFGTDNNFRLVMIAREGTAEFRSHYQKMPSSDFVTWAWNGSTGHWRTIMENAYDLYCKSEDVDPDKYYFGVSDASGQIRHFYNALDKEEINKMVQHIAIMLPK